MLSVLGCRLTYSPPILPVADSPPPKTEATVMSLSDAGPAHIVHAGHPGQKPSVKLVAVEYEIYAANFRRKHATQCQQRYLFDASFGLKQFRWQQLEQTCFTSVAASVNHSTTSSCFSLPQKPHTANTSLEFDLLSFHRLRNNFVCSLKIQNTNTSQYFSVSLSL